MTRGKQGCALSCAPDGTIREIVADAIWPAGYLQPGMRLRTLVPQDQATRVDAFLAEIARTGSALDRDLPLCVDGSTMPAHVSGSRHGDAIVIHATRTVLQFQEITRELMRMNNEQTNALRMALKELSMKSPRSTPGEREIYEDLLRANNELTNLQRELTHKNLELQALDEQKNRFVGIAAHDLRSPLSAIMGYSEFLEGDESARLGPEQQEFIGIIKDSSRFMLGLVDELLDITTIESGHMQLDRSPTDLARLVANSVAAHRWLASRKSIAIESAPAPSLPPLSIDARKIAQVLNNLLSNAVKFSQPGTRIRVTLGGEDGHAWISVQDQGPGIPAEDMGKLFKPFGRTSVRPTADERSTGLGLAIARSIVEGHGGRIWAESRPGEGSTFHFTLPTARPATAEQ